MRLADFMLFCSQFSSESNLRTSTSTNLKVLSRNNIILTKVFFQVIDGCEYTLIKLNDFFNLLQSNSFEMSSQDKKVMNKFLEETFKGVVKVNSITKFLTEIGFKRCYQI